MPYRFLPGIAPADAAFEASGTSLEELFRSAWEAALSLMIRNPQELAQATRRSLTLNGVSREMLLYSFLEELLFWKDARSELYRVESLEITNAGTGLLLEASLAGERIDPVRHELGTDVKAVTMEQLSIRGRRGAFVARVIVDT